MASMMPDAILGVGLTSCAEICGAWAEGLVCRERGFLEAEWRFEYSPANEG